MIPTCECEVACGKPFVLTGTCELEGILECDGATTLPTGSLVCVECADVILSRRALKGKKKSSKSSSSPPPPPPALPDPEEFTITFQIGPDGDLCDASGTYDAIAASTSCTTEDATFTLTVKAIAPEEEEESMSSKKKSSKKGSRRDLRKGMKKMSSKKKKSSTV